MARTACLVCFITAVNGHSKKPWKTGANSGHITNLKQPIFVFRYVCATVTHLYLPWPPWAARQKNRNNPICVALPNDGQGKYSSDCRVSLSLTVLLTYFANVKSPLCPTKNS